MAAQRLHLPLPPSLAGVDLPRVPITHVYHNADPIPQGACTGFTSPCAQAGYALETRCHLGQTIVYDTVTRLGWHADVRKHPIKELVLNVLDLQGLWPDGQGNEREVPTPRDEDNCVVGIPLNLLCRVVCNAAVCRTVSSGSLDISRTRHSSSNVMDNAGSVCPRSCSSAMFARQTACYLSQSYNHASWALYLEQTPSPQ